MSRNKTIKYVHDVTGKSYAECRRICKAASWNEDLIKIETVCGALQMFVDAIKPVFENLDAAVAEYAESCAEIARTIKYNYDSAVAAMINEIETGAES